MHITRNIGMLLGIGALWPILAILAIAAGIFILLNR
jgi:hypothetical protein